MPIRYALSNSFGFGGINAGFYSGAMMADFVSTNKTVVNHKVVISGYGLSFDNHQDHASLTKKNLNVPPVTLSRRALRFSCRVLAEALAACQHAITMSGLEPDHLSENCGLYTSQSGYQHPDIDDYQQALVNSQQSSQSTFSYLWNSRQFNPFLAIKGLPNNLLGLISIEMGIKDDCAAFVLDQQGAAAALNEALFNIQYGFVDRALVISAGTDKDIFEMCLGQHNKHTGDEHNTDRWSGELLLERKIKPTTNCLFIKY